MQEDEKNEKWLLMYEISKKLCFTVCFTEEVDAHV